MSDQSPFANQHLDHMGIAVRSIEETEKKYLSLWGKGCFHREVVEEQGVKVGFIQMGEMKIELIEALNEDSPIHKFIEKRGEGLHHLAYRVTDIQAELDRLDQQEFRLIDRTPRKGALGKWVAFIHPKSMDGVLMEICQKIEAE